MLAQGIFSSLWHADLSQNRCHGVKTPLSNLTLSWKTSKHFGNLYHRYIRRHVQKYASSFVRKQAGWYSKNKPPLQWTIDSCIYRTEFGYLSHSAFFFFAYLWHIWRSLNGKSACGNKTVTEYLFSYNSQHMSPLLGKQDNAFKTQWSTRSYLKAEIGSLLFFCGKPPKV